MIAAQEQLLRLQQAHTGGLSASKPPPPNSTPSVRQSRSTFSEEQYLWPSTAPRFVAPPTCNSGGKQEGSGEATSAVAVLPSSGGQMDELGSLLSSKERQQRLKSLNEKLARARRQQQLDPAAASTAHSDVSLAPGNQSQRQSIVPAFGPTPAGDTAVPTHEAGAGSEGLVARGGGPDRVSAQPTIDSSDFCLPGVPMDVPPPPPPPPPPSPPPSPPPPASAAQHRLGGHVSTPCSLGLSRGSSGREGDLGSSTAGYGASVSLPPMSDDANSTVTTLCMDQLSQPDRSLTESRNWPLGNPPAPTADTVGNLAGRSKSPPQVVVESLGVVSSV